MHGQDVKDVQYLLAGHNRFKQNFHPGPVDGDLGEDTAAATTRAKDALGFPTPRTSKARYEQHVFGHKLYSYLLPRGHAGWKRLPATYQVRRAARLKARLKSNTPKARALQIALHEAALHTHESPWGSNIQKFGAWYGLNREPWCAIFVSYCLSHAGKAIRTAYAYQWEYWGRAHEHGLSITHDPEAGDIVVYHHGQGHTGFFLHWVDRAAGHFQAVEGNTSEGGSQDNGGAVLVRDRWTNWAPTVFVHIS